MRWWWCLFSCWVVSNSLRLHGLQHARPCFPVLQHLPSLCQLLSIELLLPSNHLTLCCPLLLAGSFVFSSSRFSGVPSISVSLVLVIKKWLCIIDWIWHWLEFKLFSFVGYLWWFSLIYYYENRWISLFSFIFFLFQIRFPFTLLQNIEQSSLCCISRSLLIICFKQQCVRVHPKLPVYPSTHSLPPGDPEFVL